MATSRREVRGSRVFAVPLLGIALLLISYWLLSDWKQLSQIIGSALTIVHWPH